MNTVFKASKYQLTPEIEALIEKKLVAALRPLGEEGKRALIEVEVEQAPPQGNSPMPVRLEARVTVNGEVFYAEAVKSSPESAADRVRSELETEIRKHRGKARRLWRKGGAALKRMLRNPFRAYPPE